MKEPLLISSCFLGNNVKYNGLNNKLDEEVLKKLEDKYTFIIICPEVFGGLSIPRDPSEIKDDGVYSSQGIDVTANFHLGANLALNIAKRNNVKKALLKESSPSCGSNTIYDGTFTGTKIKGMGETVKLLVKEGITVYTENTVNELFTY